MVKGKTEPERIYALLGDAPMAADGRLSRRCVDRQAAFLALYRTGGFAEALPVIDGCAAAAEALGWRQGYYEMMRARVDGLIDDSPPDWNGSVCRQGKVARSPPSRRWSAAMSAASTQALIEASRGELARGRAVAGRRDQHRLHHRLLRAARRRGGARDRRPGRHRAAGRGARRRAACRCASPSIRPAPRRCARRSHETGVDVDGRRGRRRRPAGHRAGRRGVARRRRQPCRRHRALRPQPRRPAAQHARRRRLALDGAARRPVHGGRLGRGSASATAATRSAWASCRPA